MRHNLLFPFLLFAAGCATTAHGEDPANGKPDGGNDRGDDRVVDEGNEPAQPLPPSYAAVVLPEREFVLDNSAASSEQDDALRAVRPNPQGGIGILFRENAPSLSIHNFHVRYLTRDLDETGVSSTFKGSAGLGGTDFDFHPSGNATVCSWVGQAPNYELQAIRLDSEGRTVTSKVVVAPPAGKAAGGSCLVFADGEEALIVSRTHGTANTPPAARVDRITASGDVKQLGSQIPECLEWILAEDRSRGVARSSTGTYWTVDGCGIDPKTGRATRDPDRLGGNMQIAVGRGFDGNVYRVSRDQTKEGVFADTLPPSGNPVKILDDYARVLELGTNSFQTAFLFSQQGWTIPDANNQTGLGFQHAETIGSPAVSLQFDGPFNVLDFAVGGDRELYVLGWLNATGSIGNVALVHPNPNDGTMPIFVARFQDWPSIAAAHDASTD